MEIPIIADQSRRFRLQEIDDCQMNDLLSTLTNIHKWRGLLFQAVVSYYNKVLQFYKGCDGLILVNGVCEDKDDVIDFYKIGNFAEVPEGWMKGLSSFDRAVVRKQFSS